MAMTTFAPKKILTLGLLTVLGIHLGSRLGSTERKYPKILSNILTPATSQSNWCNGDGNQAAEDEIS